MAQVLQKGSEVRQKCLFIALANAISATALCNTLKRGDTNWFGSGEVLALLSIREINALVKAFGSEYSNVNTRVLLNSLVKVIRG